MGEGLRFACHVPFALGVADGLADKSVSFLEGTSLSDLYEQHADFVWTQLHRFGVREADLEDMLHEVFVVVRKRLHTFDGSAQMTTWLYGICLRVASDYRRRSFRRREVQVDSPPEIVGADTPETDLAARENERRLMRMLDELDLEKRAVFVMFELDELSCEEIAHTLGVPVGTVYSRLHAARKAFAKIVARRELREGKAS